MADTQAIKNPTKKTPFYRIKRCFGIIRRDR